MQDRVHPLLQPVRCRTYARRNTWRRSAAVSVSANPTGVSHEQTGEDRRIDRVDVQHETRQWRVSQRNRRRRHLHTTRDGFACLVNGKADAQVICVERTLRYPTSTCSPTLWCHGWRPTRWTLDQPSRAADRRQRHGVHQKIARGGRINIPPGGRNRSQERAAACASTRLYKRCASKRLTSEANTGGTAHYRIQVPPAS